MPAPRTPTRRRERRGRPYFTTSSEPEPVIASDEAKLIPRARFAASAGSNLAIPSGNSTLAGGVGRAPSGGRSRLILGTGIGIVIFLVIGSRTLIIDIFFAMPFKVKDSDSTLVCASILTLSAGWGIGMRTSGPK